MGLEANCSVKCGKFAGKGTARLEEKELLFRSGDGAFRLRIPLAEVREPQAARGVLSVRWRGGTAEFALGKDAEKWALKVRYPRSRLDKLGVKPESRVAVLGIDDEEFLRELRTRLAVESQLSAVPTPAKLGAGAHDLIFFAVAEPKPLARLAALRRAIVPAGAIWVVWPKGRPHSKPNIKEDHVRAAARKQGLVDVKVCAFSESHSALKLMIPRAQRA